jgi:hypothetical protein
MQRKPFSVLVSILMTLTACATSPSLVDAAEDGWHAGFARVAITPDQPMWMSGYGSRDRPAEGKLHDLYARAAALQGPDGHRAVFVATDLVGVPIDMVRQVAAAAHAKHGLQRADLMITCSHTHCGPALDENLTRMLDMQEGDWRLVRDYQRQLNAKLIGLVDAAIADLQPARLSTAEGVCRFAANRRAPIGTGPYDHSVPVLKITTPDGSAVRGIVFGYACHNTTLGFYQWCGDYAGFAALYLEDRHPGSTALFFAGCGGDQNPLPRRTVELAEKYGRMLAVAVTDACGSNMRPVEGALRTAFVEIDLAFDTLPTPATLQEQRAGGNRYERARAELLLERLERDGELPGTHPYPVQAWQLGDSVTWIALGGEVVVDYALRLKRELGADRTWVAAYANHVMAYIPSERVLAEGGYEGGGAMVVYMLPAPWKSGLEDSIVTAASQLTHRVRGD